MAGRSRLGVALLVPYPTAVEVDGLRRALGHRLDRIAPHITLVPPINVDDDVDVTGHLREVAARYQPLMLTIGPGGTFWPRNPVVYLQVESGDDLGGLQTALESGPLAPPARRPIRPWVPHVTVAEHVAPERIAPAIAALEHYRVEVAIHEVHLLRLDGEQWRTLTAVPLGGGRVVGRGGLEVTLESWVEGATFTVRARREGADVGMATGVLAENVSLSDLTVIPSARHQGVGSMILDEVELLAARRGAPAPTAVTTQGSWFAARGWTARAP